MSIIPIIQICILIFTIATSSLSRSENGAYDDTFSRLGYRATDILREYCGHDISSCDLSCNHDMNRRDYNDSTLLHAAILNAHHFDDVTDFISILLEKGADISIPDRDGIRPMDDERIQKIILHQRLLKVIARLKGERWR